MMASWICLYWYLRMTRLFCHNADLQSHIALPCGCHGAQFYTSNLPFWWMPDKILWFLFDMCYVTLYLWQKVFFLNHYHDIKVHMLYFNFCLCHLNFDILCSFSVFFRLEVWVQFHDYKFKKSVTVSCTHYEHKLCICVKSFKIFEYELGY